MDLPSITMDNMDITKAFQDHVRHVADGHRYPMLDSGRGNTFILSDMLPYALEPSLELVDHDGRFGGTYSVRLSVVPVSAWTLEDGASVVRIASMDTLFSGIDEWLENSIHLLKMSVILRTPLPTFASGTKCALFTNAYRDRFGWEMSDHAKAELRARISAWT